MMTAFGFVLIGIGLWLLIYAFVFRHVKGKCVDCVARKGGQR